MASKQREVDLIRALQSAPVARPVEGVPEPKRAETKTKRGRPLNLYLHDEDTRLIRTLAAYLTGQGHRVSDSQVVKAALRTAAADGRLLAAFEEALSLDQRFKRSDSRLKSA